MGQGIGQAMGPGADGGAGGGWISPNSHSQTNSPRYSPDPNGSDMVGAVAAGAGGGGSSAIGVSYPVGMVSVGREEGGRREGGIVSRARLSDSRD